MTRYLGPGLLGLVYIAMLGGIISVVGDNLNFGSQILLNDIYRRHLVKHASERHYLLAGGSASFLFSVFLCWLSTASSSSSMLLCLWLG